MTIGSSDSIALGRHPRATLAATILGSSLAFIDGSVINVALPALSRDLHATPTNLSWTVNAYLLPLGALILLGGSLGDHYGRRRLFLIALTIFTLSTLTCALAPSLSWLLASRVLQGIGAALLMPNSLAILGGSFRGEARGRAIGTWAAAGALAGALGPIIGGWLVDDIGWRAIFLLNLPVAFAAGFLGWRYLGESRSVNSVPLDFMGAGLATLALGFLTWSLTEAPVAGNAWLACATAVIGLMLTVAFLWHEHRMAERAIVPPALFSSKTFIGLTLSTFFLYGSLGGLLVLLPYLLIRIEHWSAAGAGAALLPIPVIIGMSSRLMGKITTRFGGRLPLTVGSALVGLGLALYARVGVEGVQYWVDVFPPTFLVALGMGICVAPLTTTVLTSVATDHVGVASGFNSAVARIAGLVATALLGFVFVRQGSLENFITGFRAAALISAAAADLGAVCALWLIEAT
jgi:EmrB/QacA subfamily drug resistance transporter